jgi:glutamate N-acetyltransferase/amino-acid N-acetyltransferase
MQGVAASVAGGAADAYLVCSTGLIGDFLPMDKIVAAGPLLKQQLSEDGGADASQAILTTDTHPKTVVIEGDGFTVGGMVKGAGMMAPNMATMICVLTTDAQADPQTLQAVLKDSVTLTFNSLTIDGCTSTNDTCILLSSGKGAKPSQEALTDAVSKACAALALELASDAEGATKVVHVRVSGAESDEAARKCARQIAESSLVKCSFYGELPYWGRVLCEAGVAGVAMDPEKSSVAYGGVKVADGGMEIPFDETAAIAQMQKPEWDLDVVIGDGPGKGEILTVDLTHDYIKENMGRS